MITDFIPIIIEIFGLLGAVVGICVISIIVWAISTERYDE